MIAREWYIRLNSLNEADYPYMEIPVDLPYLSTFEQDTKSNYVNITIMNNGQLMKFPDFTYVLVTIDKPDSTQWISSGEVVGEGQVRVGLDYQALSALGIAKVTVKIYTETQILTSPSFQIKIYADPLSGTDASIESASDYPVLTDLITGYTGSLSNMSIVEGWIADPSQFIGPQGIQGIQGIKGDKGDSIEYIWNGTQLGIRIEGEANYIYVNLKGDQGIQGEKGDKGDQGVKGDTGATGNGIASVVRTSGNGAAGTTDTYTITFTNSSTATFQVYNGADGEGAGDMLKSQYDTDGDGKVNAAVNADTVNDKTVAENVPSGAVFTDTITTINGKTGSIVKADIVALGIPSQDTVYTHPATHSADIIVDGTTNKAYTATEKTKLSGIAENANNYSHPANHSPSIITQDANNRFVTDAEKSTWNGKADGDHAHTGVYEPANATILKDADIGVTVQGYNANTVVDANYVHTDNNYTTSEKNKLSGIETGATADQTASEVPYSNTTSGLTATTVQAAIDEIDTALDNLSADAVDISIADTGTLYDAVNVETALAEVMGDLNTHKAEIATDAHADTPGARVTRSSDVSIPSSIDTWIPFNVETFDVSGMWDIGSPTKLTCTVTGRYLVLFGCGWNANPTGVRFAAITKNGSVISNDNKPGNSSIQTNNICFSLIDLAIGDYVEVVVHQSSGVALNLSYPNLNLNIVKVG